MVRSTDEFRILVARAEADVDLDAACLLIGARARPDLDPLEVVAAGRAELDRLAAGCADATVDALRARLFDGSGFTGNRTRYHDPANSYLDVVLARRTGIPITLAVVVMEVGRRVGLHLHGVGMPGHFLVGADDGDGVRLYVDAFDRGRVLDEQECRRRYTELAGPGAPWSSRMLAPVGARAILGRVLANLRVIFEGSQHLAGLDWVMELRLAIPGTPPAERAGRASVLAALGRYDEAATELEALAAAAGGELAADLRSRAARLRARLN